MRKRAIILYLFIINYSLLILLTGCGNDKSPTGGPKDVILPKITNISPNEFQEISNTEIEVVFSKPINRSSIIAGLRIYPPIINKKFSWDRTILTIKIEENLQPLNYYFIFSQDIIGEHKNPLEKEYTFVFTGDQLHENSINGSFIYPEQDKNKLVSTSISALDSTVIFKKDFANDFKYEYLNPDTLIFQAFIDHNKNEKYDFEDEPYFKQIVAPQSITILPVELVYVDTLKPKLKKINVNSSTSISLEFSENIKKFSRPVITLDDSLKNEEIKIFATELSDNVLDLLIAETDTLQYFINIDSFTDLADNKNSVEKFYFDGTAKQDSFPPKILKLIPGNGKMISSLKPEIIVEFSEIILRKDIDIKLFSSENKEEIDLVFYKVNSKKYILKPNKNLINYNSYRLFVADSTTDFCGNALLKSKENKFIVIKK